jgi:hypothetical protein
VWQKSNETDFLLTMNFILFTNQGYPLSRPQGHSAAGRIMLMKNSSDTIGNQSRVPYKKSRLLLNTTLTLQDEIHTQKKFEAQ